MKIVSLTKSYPAPGRPADGCFIQARLAALSKLCRVRVVHAVPFSRRLPADDPGGTPPVERVRYAYLPRVGKRFDHLWLARAAAPRFESLLSRGELDVIDAHFGFPEGAAAVRIGRRLGVPVVVTLRGTELDFEDDGARGRVMAAALRDADRVIAVSGELANLALRLGVRGERVFVIGNGVDDRRFAPGDRRAERRRLALPVSAKVVLSVGALIERKGHDHVIRMLRELDTDTILVVAGSGPLLGKLRRLCRCVGVASRVRFVGQVDRDTLPRYYRAADVVALASRREGDANVLREALASGVPVVATEVGAARETVLGGHLGALVPYGRWQTFCVEVSRALSRRWDGDRIRRHALARPWERVATRVHRVFEGLTAAAAEVAR